MYKISDYQQIQGNYYLGGRNYGACKKLIGNVNVLTVFMKRSSTDWSDSAKKNYFVALHKAADHLMSEALRYGAYLNIKCYNLETTVSPKADPKRGFSLVKRFFHKNTANGIIEYYKGQIGGDEFPIILAFNEKGRGFSFEENSVANYKTEELSVIFSQEKDDTLCTATSIAHELLHQFGAVDYYYPDKVKKLAEKYFSNSIMGIGKAYVDDLTAYLIGWKDTISANSYWFLKETMWMDENQNAEDTKNEWKKDITK